MTLRFDKKKLSYEAQTLSFSSSSRAETRKDDQKLCIESFVASDIEDDEDSLSDERKSRKRKYKVNSYY